jgi:hypothetical protein
VGRKRAAPVELIAFNEPDEGVISARREGEPDFSHVQDVADAAMAALACGVDLVVPAALFEERYETKSHPIYLGTSRCADGRSRKTRG